MSVIRDRPDEATARQALLDSVNRRSASRPSADSAEAVLWHLLTGSTDADPARLPGAVCRWHGETGRRAEPPLVCADPVNFRADRDAARITPAEALVMDDTQADALIASLNALVADDGLRFLRGHATTWYLQGMPAAALSCQPASRVAYQHIDHYPPPLADGAHWRRLMSEVQMLLHAHEVNAMRAARGLAAINGLWFWGGGTLGQADPALRDRPLRLFADDAFARGLAAELGLACEPLDAAPLTAACPPPSVADPGECLVVVDTGVREALLAADIEALEQALGRLARSRLLLFQDWLDRGLVARVTIDTGESLAVDLPARPASWWSRLRQAIGR